LLLEEHIDPKRIFRVQFDDVPSLRACGKMKIDL